MFLDDLGHNVRSAREVGMTAVRVRETETALRELEILLGVRLLLEEKDYGRRDSSSNDTELDNKLGSKL